MSSSLNRRWVALAAGAMLAAAAVVPLACSGDQCDDAAWRCGADGRLYCSVIPPGVDELPRECCAAPNPAAPSGEDAGTPGPDAGTEAPPTDGGLEAPPTDGGLEAPPADAGLEAPAADAGEESCGDASIPEPDGGFPTGTDEDGINYLYVCGIDLCHPLPAMPADAGGGGENCGPVGCN